MDQPTQNDPLGIVGMTIDGKYQVESMVGEGGAAVVYRATNAEWKLPVAMKFYLAFTTAPLDAREKLLEEFVQEGRLMSKLSSRSSAITQPRDMGAYTRLDGSWIPYLVLEWLEGAPLDYVLVDETNHGIPPRSLEQAMALLEPAASALEIAHRENIIHRDIKPENLFVLGDARGPNPRLKVFDFGIAKIMQDSIGVFVHTAAAATPFTPHYGAPEQFSRSYGTTGPWTDVFALALVVLEVMRGGERVFSGNDYLELSTQSRSEDVRPTPRVLGMVVSDDVEAVFARALALRPHDRYASAGDFWQALYGAVYPQRGTWKTELSIAPPPVAPASSAPRATTTTPRQSGGSRSVILGAVALGVLIIGGASFLGAQKFLAQRASASASATSTGPTASAPIASTPSAPLTSSASAAPTTARCPESATVVPGGSFMMGDADVDRAGPPHRVFLDAFCLDKAEVTPRAYSACVSAGACKVPTADVKTIPSIPPGDPADCTFGRADREDKSLDCVTFEEAAAYCTWAKMRLPTEAEWEYAARQKKIDSAGIALAEWVADAYAKYADEDQVNPKGPSSGDTHVVRGMRAAGSSSFDPFARLEGMSTLRHPIVGFRCASDIAKK